MSSRNAINYDVYIYSRCTHLATGSNPLGSRYVGYRLCYIIVVVCNLGNNYPQIGNLLQDCVNLLCSFILVTCPAGQLDKRRVLLHNNIIGKGSLCETNLNLT